MRRTAAGKIEDRARDLFATLHGRLDWVCEIFVVRADQTKINKHDMARERITRDQVVEHGERDSRDAAQIGIRKARVIDGADSGRELSAEHEIEHAAVSGSELLAHIGKLRHNLGNRACPFLEESRLAQCIVSACADDEVSCIIWDAIKLRIDVPYAGTIQRVERGMPTLRQYLAELGQHVGSARNVSSVIENGIAEQHRTFACGIGCLCLSMSFVAKPVPTFAGHALLRAGLAAGPRLRCHAGAALTQTHRELAPGALGLHVSGIIVRHGAV